MADKSKIEWTEATWNPIAGCAIVSKGCTNCYAMKVAARLEAMGQAKYAGLTKTVNGKPVWTGKISVAGDDRLTQPLRWKRGRRIFVNSMSDLFHENVSVATIDRVFNVMARTPQHTYQILTKRPRRMWTYMAVGPRLADIQVSIPAWPLPNVWLGVSVEDQTTADERIPILLDTPAAVRWISAEPLLGPVRLDQIEDCDNHRTLDALRGKELGGYEAGTDKIDWVVAGGESGPDARPMHPDWVRSIRDQCAAAGAPFLFKQWGEHWPAEKVRIGEGGEVWRTDADGGESWSFDELGAASAPCVRYMRVGKKAAGRTLDGRMHDVYPR